MSYILCNMKERVKIIFGLALLVLISCGQPADKVHREKLEELTSGGEFSSAEQLIDSLKQSGRADPVLVEKMDSLLDMMHRIRLDFDLNEDQVKEQLSRYFPGVDDSMITRWEQAGKLEMRPIDGEKRYFGKAVPNLFRLDTVAARRKTATEGEQVDSLDLFCLEHTEKIIQESKVSSDPVLPVDMILTYTVRLKPDAVPDGKMVRCWMPFPREGDPRQKNVHLLSSDPDSAVIAPESYLQRTVYLTKAAVKDQSTVFQIRFSVETSGQYFDLKPEDMKPYDTGSSLFKKYTAERPPQIVFTPQIKQLASQITGDETNPLRKVEKIYQWINDSIPWASALEYCTMPQIPGYVLKNRHGDCGMQTLLFMSMARSQGIPVKWQSGWMLHPGHVNLHDWCEVYYEGIGWVPLDQSFKLQHSPDRKLREFYVHGIDSYRLIVNDDYGQKLYPPKKFMRSEPYDFQRGELEWAGGNLYFDQWSWHMDVERRR